jgi:DnaJ-class molecular chaperone
MDEDYYKILGISRNAQESEIQKAYRELARKYHPDLNLDDKSAKGKFQEVQKAFTVLSDPGKRELYDRYGSSFESMAGGPQAGGPRQYSGNASFEDIDLGELFGQRFADGSEGGFSDIFKQFTKGSQRPGRQSRSRQRGADIQHELTVPFKVAVTGGEAKLKIRRAGGKTETLSVKIPTGIEDGRKVRLRGQGDKNSASDVPGDIIITVHISSHPNFVRAGNNLEVKVPISLSEAVSGATIDVPTPQGTISLKVPAGSSSGTRLRIKGHGVKLPKARQGDLYAELQIVLPASMSQDDLAQLEQLAERYPLDPRANLTW